MESSRIHQQVDGSLNQRVQVPKFGVIVILVQVLGKYMIIGYLDP